MNTLNEAVKAGIVVEGKKWEKFKKHLKNNKGKYIATALAVAGGLGASKAINKYKYNKRGKNLSKQVRDANEKAIPPFDTKVSPAVKKQNEINMLKQIKKGSTKNPIWT